MEEHLAEKSEKKVEYIELIYDLIFVYLVGRNNALLHTLSGGFFTASTYFTYILSSLVILQVWYFSTLFINRYGTSGVSDHVFLFINMYLLFYMADGMRADWFGYYMRYNAAWGLILINLAVQYFLRLHRSSGMTPWEDRHIRYHARLLLVQAGVVLVSIPLYSLLRFPLSWLSLIVGFAAAAFTARIETLMPVNFEHLTERVMLYVVFTFGEMIVSIAEYFEGGFSFGAVYLSLMVFLIVGGLFLSYGFLYNRLIDRQRTTSGMGYMLIHIGLILSLSNLVVALEFMPNEAVAETAKNVFLVVSFLCYYLFMFLLGYYVKEGCRAGGRFLTVLLGISAVFAGLMALCYKNGRISIAVSVLFVYAVFGLIVLRYRRVAKSKKQALL